MLNFFRRQHSRLKWIWIVVIFIFSVTLVTLYIPVTEVTHINLSSNVASVGDEIITAREFQNVYHGYVDQLGSEMTPELLEALGYHDSILNAIIDEYVMIAEAKRLGLEVSARELRQAILENPTFQDQGAFIGMELYRQLIEQNGMTVAEFEDSLKNQLLVQKMYEFLTAPMALTDHEVEKEYRYSNETAVIEYFIIDGPAVAGQIELTDEELRAYFEENSAQYTEPERRQASLVFINTTAVSDELEVPEDELREYYNERISDYQIEPRVTAQHILFRTQGLGPEEVAEIRETAVTALERARVGEDFGDLAREFSEDASASAGGDLGSFGPGQMVPAFEAAAFALETGGISDLVETDFGIHIIKVNDKQEGRTLPFENVEASIDSAVRFERAEEVAAARAQAIAVELVENDDVQAVADEYGATVRETGLMARGDVFNGLSDTAALESMIFSLGLNETGTAVEVANGHVIPIVTRIEDSRPSTFEEAADDVEVDLRTERAAERAEELTAEVERIIADGGTLAQAAEAAGLTVQTSDPVTREGSIPGFGSTAEMDPQIFGADVGVPADPVSVSGRTIAFQVIEREAVDAETMTALLPELRSQLLDLRKNQFFSAYSVDARTRMERDGEIRVNQGVLARAAEAAVIGHNH